MQLVSIITFIVTNTTKQKKSNKKHCAKSNTFKEFSHYFVLSKNFKPNLLFRRVEPQAPHDVGYLLQLDVILRPPNLHAPLPLLPDLHVVEHVLSDTTAKTKK